MKVLLVSPGQTDWTEQHRVKGNLDVPLNSDGIAETERIARELLSVAVRTVYCPTTLDGKQTAEIIARITRARVRPRRGLNDVDQGLWQGLTVDELKRKHPHAYRRWMNAPGSVQPPRGEKLTMAFGRVRAVVNELKRKKKSEAVVCVVPSVIRRMLACQLQGKQLEEVAGLNGKETAVEIVEL